MKKFAKVFISIILTVIFMITATASSEAPTEVTILFTHDLHSHFLPAEDTDGGQYGGYARLMTVIKQQREKDPDALLVDGGDFAMGSLFQTAYATSATELRMMGAMGYDATTFGNHEYDYLQDGLKSMLNAAVASGDKLPAIVQANYWPPAEGEEGYDSEMWAALENYGVKDYIIMERGGAYFVVFGIFGHDADACAPNSGMKLRDPITTAQKIVDQATKECSDTYGAEPVVICLSHSGTSGGEGEDYELAKAVNGIDLIISGHTHTTLSEPITVGQTAIVSAAEYGRNLGVVRLSITDGNTSVAGYELIPIDENVEEDAEIAQKVEGFKKNVENDYLSKYGVGFDEVLVNNKYKFDTVDEVYATQHESTLCNIFSDAYRWAASNALGKEVDVALTAAGVIRESLPEGEITVSDVFNAASLGVGTEGELIAVYVTGADLKNALEVDASVQPLMRSAQLFFSGVEYSFNTNRMIFNKVDYAMLRRNDGTLEAIENHKLYCVVTGMYAGQMLGSVESTSMGLIAITPRDSDGNPLTADQLVDHVIKDENGNPIKEWYAIASYLQDMGGEMDEKYSETDGRKAVYSSLNPIKLLRNANKFTYILLAIAAVLIAVIVLIVVAIVKKVKKSKAKKMTASTETTEVTE
ncbi:MAG: bifunctional metallophosphatase/5'-nucleotidase [Clostridia bacterium]|nr:bifunctional metallophosphatase/5'-nucleotidase [Clostridia bacterium]